MTLIGRRRMRIDPEMFELLLESIEVVYADQRAELDSGVLLELGQSSFDTIMRMRDQEKRKYEIETDMLRAERHELRAMYAEANEKFETARNALNRIYAADMGLPRWKLRLITWLRGF